MLIRLAILALPVLALSGCISLGLGSAPPGKTTVVVPQSAAAGCMNSDGSPCQPTH